MVYFWMVAFSYGINLLLGQDLKFVKGFLAVSYSILKCILCSISCEDIRKGKLFTSREKNPRVLSISIHNLLHKCGTQVVFNTWWQFKHSSACQKPAQQCPIVFPSHDSASSWAAHTHLLWPQQNSTVSAPPLGIVKLENMLHRYKEGESEQQNYLIKRKKKSKISKIQLDFFIIN